MSISETLRQKRLILKDTLGLGLTAPADNRIHLDAAIAWLKRAQDVTGNGGVAQTYDYWKMTGGKGLGVISSFTDLDNIPLTPKTIPLVKKAHARKIPMQIHVHIA